MYIKFSMNCFFFNFRSCMIMWNKNLFFCYLNVFLKLKLNIVYRSRSFNFIEKYDDMKSFIRALEKNKIFC